MGVDAVMLQTVRCEAIKDKVFVLSAKQWVENEVFGFTVSNLIKMGG